MRNVKGRPVVAIVLLFATALIVAAQPAPTAVTPVPATVPTFEATDLGTVAGWLRNYPEESVMVTGGTAARAAEIAVSIENLGINPARVSIQVMGDYGSTVTIRER